MWFRRLRLYRRCRITKRRGKFRLLFWILKRFLRTIAKKVRLKIQLREKPVSIPDNLRSQMHSRRRTNLQVKNRQLNLSNSQSQSTLNCTKIPQRRPTLFRKYFTVLFWFLAQVCWHLKLCRFSCDYIYLIFNL